MGGLGERFVPGSRNLCAGAHGLNVHTRRFKEGMGPGSEEYSGLAAVSFPSTIVRQHRYPKLRSQERDMQRLHSLQRGKAFGSGLLEYHVDE